MFFLKLFLALLGFIIFQCSTFSIVNAILPKLPGLDSYTPIFNPVTKLGNGRWRWAFTAKAHFHVLQMIEVESHGKTASRLISFGGVAATRKFNATITTTNSHFMVRNAIGAGVVGLDGSFVGEIFVFGDEQLKEGQNEIPKGMESWYFTEAPYEFWKATGISTVKSIFADENDHTCGFGDDEVVLDEDSSSQMRDENEDSTSQMWAEDENDDSTFQMRDESISAKMRDDDSSKFEKKTCSVKFVVDNLVWDQLMNETSGWEEEVTRQINQMINDHVADLNKFYWPQKFGKVKEFAFRVADLKIFKEPISGILSPINIFRSSEQLPIVLEPISGILSPINIFRSSEQLPIVLGDFTKTLHGIGNCLAILLTFRHKSRFTQGIAVRGGVCRSAGTNVAVVNLAKNPLKRHSYADIQYHLRHEVAHAMGAHHDNDNQCSPLITGKKFLMHNITFSEDTRNIFSKCSIDEITALMESVLKMPKGKRQRGMANTNCLE